MLKKFVLRNYKNFRENICIDFENVAGYQFNTDCITDGMISKMLVYGRNATGKTNLGKALMDIRAILLDMPVYTGGGIIVHADAKEDSAVFSYTFQFGDKELVYTYARLSNLELKNEELVIDGTIIFNCDYANEKYDFDNLKYIGAETANVERYVQSLNAGEETEGIKKFNLSFLRWLISNVALEKESVLIRLANYISRMVILTARNAMSFYVGGMNTNFYDSLEEPEKLQELQEFLNEMGIECRLKLKKLPDGQNGLYFAHEKLIPFFENASSGTLALMNLYRRVVSKARDASLLYLDEFDAFFHYEMAENVVGFLKRRYPGCQLIMTSHNTNLMTNRLMRPDCLFILSGAGTLTALCNATERELREGHNLEKMYISGEFEQYE